MVATVACGFPVSWSSALSFEHANPRLTDNTNECAAWCAKTNDENQWLQVCFISPRVVKAVDIAGRPDKHNQYVKAFRLYHTLDGVDWFAYNAEEPLEGNEDTANVIRHDLDEFEALAVRLCPTDWNKHIAMRLEVHVAK